MSLNGPLWLGLNLRSGCVGFLWSGAVAVDCATLQAELDAAKALLAIMRQKSLVRSVFDSDGSRIEYSSTGLTSQETYVRRLEAQMDALCNGCRQAAGPFGYVFP